MTLNQLLEKGGKLEVDEDFGPYRFEILAPKGKQFMGGKEFLLAFSMANVHDRLAGTWIEEKLGYFGKEVA